jgi:hypothetical protein
MTMTRRETRFFALPALLFAAALLAASPRPAAAAEGYDSCTGYVDTLPATLTTAGTWCLRANLATALATGNAVTIASNNVVLDCNQFAIDGTGGGSGTATVGVLALNRTAVVVRNCALHGFYRGVSLVGNNSEVRGNRIVNARFHGVFVAGDDLLVQDNAVLGTGGSTTIFSAIGIYVSGRVDTLGNLVAATTATAGSNGNATGIYYGAVSSGSIRDNRVFEVAGAGAGLTAGIRTDSAGRVLISRNHILSNDDAGTGLECLGADIATSSARDNTIIAFADGLEGCPDDATSNVWLP